MSHLPQCVNLSISLCKDVYIQIHTYTHTLMQSTLEQHRFELYRSTYIQIFFSINTVYYYKYIFPYDFNIFFCLAYFIIGIQYLIHIAYKIICVNWCFMLSVRLPVKNSYQQLKFGGVQSYTCIFDCARVYMPNPCIVQGSTVYVMYTCIYVCIMYIYTQTYFL